MNAPLRHGLLLLASTMVYSNTLANGFAQDDDIYILQNHAVTAYSFTELFSPNYFSHVFRPLTFLTLSANWFLGGAHPFAYHLINLLLHSVVTLLVYLLLQSLLEPLPEARTIAFAAALLFAIHPIHTEAVTGIVGRSEMLAAGFLVAAWLLHLRERHLSALLCFSCALLAKESAIVFLPLLFICDYARRRLQPVLCYISFAGITLLYLGTYWKAQGGRFATVIPFLDNPLFNLPASLRILNGLRVAWKYLGLHFYPAALSCDYSYTAITLYANGRLVGAALASAGIVFLWGWAVFRHHAKWAVASTIYLVGFAVTSNLFFPIGTIMGERLAYLPSVGFCLLVALLWKRLESFQPRLAWALLIMVLAALSLRTVLRNRDWHDNFTLYSAALQVVPGSAKMHNGIGVEYARRGELNSARREFETALAIYPAYPEALESFGLLESITGKDQESRRHLEAALALAQKGSVNYNFAVANLASQYIKLGENDLALKLLDQDILDSPTYARAWANRAVVRYKSGRPSEARSDAQTALRLDPENSQARALLSLLNASSPATPSN